MKNIIITGASGNLGRSVTTEFGKGAYHMNLADTKPEENTENKTAWYPDLKDPVAVQGMVTEIIRIQGEIHAAIHLVGGYKPGILDETSSQDVNEMVALNFNTAFNLVQALLPSFKKNGGGKFVFIGAKAAMNPATAGYNVAYALSKQMLIPFAQMINEAYGAAHVSAHVLLPSTLDTALNRSLMPDSDFSQWTSTVVLAETMRAIIDGAETRETIVF